MEQPPILITGVTGNVGGEVARVLLAEGVRFRALVRNRAKASDLSRAGVAVVDGNYDDPESLFTAFAGVERLLLVSPLVPQLEELEGNAIAAAARVGVRHVAPGHEAERRLRVDEPPDRPRRGDPVDVDAFSSDEVHRWPRRHPGTDRWVFWHMEVMPMGSVGPGRVRWMLGT